MIQKILTHIEKTKITPRAWIATFLSIVTIRVILESFSSAEGKLFTITALPHTIFFFGSVIASFIIIIHLFSKTNVQTAAKIALFGWVISLTPPIIDLIVTSGKGGLTIAYLFEPTQNLAKTYITLFFTENTDYFTYGVKTQAALGCIAIAVYTYIKTKNILKSFFATLATYTTTYLFLILPTILTIIETGSLLVDNKEIFNFSFLPLQVFSIKIINPARVFDYKLSTFLIFILATQALFLVWRYNKSILKNILKNARLSRIFLSLISFSTGLFIAIRIFNFQKQLSAIEYATIGLAMIVQILLWMFSFLINDREDVEIDKLTNSERPTATNTLTSHQISTIAYISALCANLIAYMISLRMLTLTLGITAISYLYSVKPFRLKRFPFIASFIIATTVILSTFIGYMFIAPDQSLETFPKKLIMLILMLFTLAVNTKDIKDQTSDSKHNVFTIPAIFGEKNGKLILAILNTIGIVLFGTLLSSNPILLGITALTAIIVFLLTYDKNTKEKYILITYTIYFFVAVLFVY